MRLPSGFSTSFGVKSQLLLSDKILGYFMIPEDDKWNYSFMGAQWSNVEKKKEVYVKVGHPWRFYDGGHRPVHFASFGELEDFGVENRDDNFA